MPAGRLARLGATLDFHHGLLTLNLPITFAPTFGGTKTVFMYGGNAGGINSGWVQRGTWTVP